MVTERPKCQVPGCTRNAQLQSDLATGKFRKMKWVREDFGVQEGYVCQVHHKRKCAENKGMSIGQWTNSFHIYRKYRKDYCENIDGRIGGNKCTATIVYEGQLQVDHIDGNPTNNDPSNLQTLCANCHTHKTYLNADYATLGRKALKNVA
jgi:5-methylcytosine-specific restriction endonuclease McrA